MFVGEADQTIPLGKWMPDKPQSYPEPHLREVQNAFPTLEGYLPSSNSLRVTESTYFSGSPVALGAGTFYDLDGVAHTYQGVSDKLAQLAPTLSASYLAQTWDDRSRTVGGAYSTPSDGLWSFCSYEDTVIATNGVDAVQEKDMSAPGDYFGALGGSPPIAKLCITVGDFVVLLNLATDGVTAIHWSSSGNPTEWTKGTNLGDGRIFSDGGEIIGAIAAGNGVFYIFQEKCIRRGLFVGAPLVFQFEKISDMGMAQGAHRALCRHGNKIAFLGSDFQFYILSDDGSLASISEGQVSEWWRAHYHHDYPEMVSMSFDPTGQWLAIGWALSRGETNVGEAEAMLFYHLKADKWGLTEETNVREVGIYDIDVGSRGAFLGYFQNDDLYSVQPRWFNPASETLSHSINREMVLLTSPIPLFKDHFATVNGCRIIGYENRNDSPVTPTLTGTQCAIGSIRDRTDNMVFSESELAFATVWNDYVSANLYHGASGEIWRRPINQGAFMSKRHGRYFTTKIKTSAFVWTSAGEEIPSLSAMSVLGLKYVGVQRRGIM